MKTIIHKASDRGHADHGWLKANHSFSFANYFDPEKIQFGALRVLNDDTIAPKMGFGTHPHDNMEIITIPLSGVLKHRDNMGSEWQEVKPGEVQVMSAGTGVSHSEINGSMSDDLNLFQIWIIPNRRNVAPKYGQQSFSTEDRKNRLQKLVTSVDDPHKNSLKIYQDAVIARTDLDAGTTFTYEVSKAAHGLYVMVIEGGVTIGDHQLGKRDALAITESNAVLIESTIMSQLLFIEVPIH